MQRTFNIGNNNDHELSIKVTESGRAVVSLDGSEIHNEKGIKKPGSTHIQHDTYSIKIVTTSGFLCPKFDLHINDEVIENDIFRNAHPLGNTKNALMLFGVLLAVLPFILPLVTEPPNGPISKAFLFVVPATGILFIIIGLCIKKK